MSSKSCVFKVKGFDKEMSFDEFRKHLIDNYDLEAGVLPQTQEATIEATADTEVVTEPIVAEPVAKPTKPKRVSKAATAKALKENEVKAVKDDAKAKKVDSEISAAFSEVAAAFKASVATRFGSQNVGIIYDMEKRASQMVDADMALAKALYNFARTVLKSANNDWNKASKKIRTMLKEQLDEDIDDKSMSNLLADAVNGRDPQAYVKAEQKRLYGLEQSTFSEFEVTEQRVKQRLLDGDAPKFVKDMIEEGVMEIAVQKTELAIPIAAAIVDEFGEAGAKALVATGKIKGALGTFVLGNVVDRQVARKENQIILNQSIDQLTDHATQTARALGALYHVYTNSAAGIYAVNKRVLEKVNEEVKASPAVTAAATALQKGVARQVKAQTKAFVNKVAKHKATATPSSIKTAKAELEALNSEAKALRTSLKDRLNKIRQQNAGMTPISIIPGMSPDMMRLLGDADARAEIVKLMVNLVKRGYYNAVNFKDKMKAELTGIGLAPNADDLEGLWSSPEVSATIQDLLNSGKVSMQDIMAQDLKSKGYELDYKQRAQRQAQANQNKLADLLRTNVDERGRISDALIDDIMTTLGVDATQATQVRAALQQELDQMIAAAIRKEVDKTVKKYGRGLLKRNAAKVTDKAKGRLYDLMDISRVAEAGKNQSVADALSSMFGGVDIDADVEATMLDYAKRLRAAGNTAARDVVSHDLSVYVNSLFPTTLMQKYWAIFFPQQLSGISTQAVNVLSSIYNIASDEFAVLPATFSEIRNLGFKTMFGAAYNIAGMSTSAAKLALQTGATKGRFQDVQTGIGTPGKNKTVEDEIFDSGLGKAFQTLLKYFPTRFMQATDQFFHETSYEMSLFRNIYREQRAQGLKGEALRTSVMSLFYGTQDVTDVAVTSAAEIVENSGYEVTKEHGQDPADRRNWTTLMKRVYRDQVMGSISNSAKASASATAKRNVFRDRPAGTMGLASKMLSAAVEPLPILRWLVPYINVPFNIANMLMDYDPIIGGIRSFSGKGAASSAISSAYMRSVGIDYTSLSESASNKTGREFIPEEYAKQRMRWIMGLTAVTMAAAYFAYFDDDDDDETWIMGSGNINDPTSKQTRPEYTISIKGVQIPYEATPLFIPLSLVGNALNYVRNNTSKPEGQKEQGIWLACTTMAMTYRGVTDQMPIESLQALTETIFNLASGKTRDPMDVVKNAVGGTIRNVSTGIPVIGLNFLKQASKFADPASYYKMDGYSFIAGSLGYSVLIPETLSGEEYTRVDHRGRETKYYPGDQLLHYAHNLDLLDNDEVDTWLDANNANYMAADKARAYYSFYLNPDDPTREVGMVRLDEDTRVLRMAAITGGKLMNSFLEEAYPRMRDIENPVLIKAIVNEANRLQQRHVIQSIEEATHENLDIQRLELSTDWSSVKDEISVPVIVNGEEKSEKVSLLKVVTSGRYTQDQMLEMFDLQSEEVMQDKARESAVKRLEK